MNVSHKPPVTFSSREFNQDTARVTSSRPA